MDRNGPVTWAEWDKAEITIEEMRKARFTFEMLGDRNAFDHLLALRKRPLGKEDA